jgi:hypothetical protein
MEYEWPSSILFQAGSELKSAQDIWNAFIEFKLNIKMLMSHSGMDLEGI